ncbi:hypothetical protein JM83_1694 [Gillisia sp. Hel_I_86]|uniref:hypothetical protein n=1 Tax=Gillisia sp. Hel_I_86 TaxID=1249981 RepID=UPI00119C39C2|nr:hypothetical protein [Gillisia sp. Hel_I_86]TVZ26707.1 hypothetical protein JM83_1694 [Gillisia sp. Hel_I_86]
MGNSNKPKYQKLIKALDQYSIGDITELQKLVVGMEIIIDLEKPVYDQDLDQTYEHESVIITMDKCLTLEVDKELFKSGYYDRHFYRRSKNVRLSELQTINYADFIYHKNDFREKVEEKLIEIEENITEYLNHYIHENLPTPHYPRHLLNKVILSKIRYSNNWMNTNYSNPPEENIFPFFNKFDTFPELMPVMTMVQDRQANFIKFLETEFKYYYDKSDLEKYLDKLDKEFQKKKKTPIHPDFFKSEIEYECFTEYLNENVVKKNPYKAIGYVFKRMLFEKKIHKITDMQFAFFLKDRNLITIEMFDFIIEKNQFDSLGKSKSEAREAAYDLIFKR